MDRPHFLHIGTQKTGSDWLALALNRHPGLWLPPVKNILYFNPKFQFHRLRKFRKHSHRLITKPEERRWLARYFFTPLPSDSWYRGLYPDDGRLCGEVAENYCVLPEDRIARVQSFVPDCKIILVMRDPVNQAISNGKMFVRKHDGEDPANWKDENFWKYLAKDGYEMFSAYAQILDRWGKFFPQAQICPLFYDELVENPLGFIAKICGFLGVDFDPDIFRPALGERKNVSPKSDVPAFFRKALVERYRDEIVELDKRFGSYASRWRQSLDG
ncbi:MAG: sulfotransferase [Spartobacteria bacterium]|nr:sulfotransferase [Spartobacteria bacterium]